MKPSNQQMERLVIENPNLSASKLASIAKVHKNTIINTRRKLGVNHQWFHFGVGIPFVDYDPITTSYRVRKDGRKIYNGSFSGAMDNLDRLIFCLDNNQGELPKTMEESIFSDLEFLKNNMVTYKGKQ